MTSLRGPLLYSNPGHPWHSLPLSLVDQIGPRGITGIYSEFYSFAGYPSNTLTDGIGGTFEISESGSSTLNNIVDVAAVSPKGVLRLQCDTNAGDYINLQGLSQAFRYVVGKRMWFGIRCRLEDLDQDAMIAGLAAYVADNDFINLHMVDGITFHKAGTDTDLDFEIFKDSTVTDTTNAGGTLVNDQWMVLGFYVDVLGNVFPYQAQNGAALVVGSNPALTNVPDDENLGIVFGIETADGGGDYMDVDWVFAAQEI